MGRVAKLEPSKDQRKQRWYVCIPAHISSTGKWRREYLSDNKITQSMSAKGYCYDNAHGESFFATLKKESFPPKQTFENPTHARREIFSYIEGFYNTQRIHPSLNNLSPNQFYTLHLN